jgi:hypothetical protein
MSEAEQWAERARLEAEKMYGKELPSDRVIVTTIEALQLLMAVSYREGKKDGEERR